MKILFQNQSCIAAKITLDFLEIQGISLLEIQGIFNSRNFLLVIQGIVFEIHLSCNSRNCV
jgi:hypothetical protein